MRHVNEADAGHHLKQLAGKVAGVPMPPDAMLILARVGFRVRDKFGDRFGRDALARIMTADQDSTGC
jgi:hypothetical protein